MSRKKELNFFIKERNWDRGVEWYRSNFAEPPPSDRIKIFGESSPNYTNYPVWRDVPQRMFSVVPHAKLIYIVRNPVERMISQYSHHCAEGEENRPIEQAFYPPQESFYPVRSRYFFQLSQYLEHFPSDQILVLTLEDLASSPRSTMKQIFHFLGVAADFEFKFDLTKTKELLTFGPAIASPSFNFDTKLHQSALKNCKRIDENSPISRTMSKLASKLGDKLAGKLPVEPHHLEKLMYLPFSRKVQRPSLDAGLRASLLDYLAEDIDSLAAFTGRSFIEWTDEAKL